MESAPSSVKDHASTHQTTTRRRESPFKTGTNRIARPRYRFNPWAAQDVLPTLIFQCERDEEGEILWVMAEGPLAQRLGLSTRSVKGTPIYRQIPRELGKNWYGHIAAVFQGKGGDWVNEHEGRYYNHYPQPMTDENGTVIGVVGHTIDTTELVEAQHTIDDLVEARRASAQILDRTKNEMETLNYTLSHDLRNPLTVIIAQCELAQRDAKDNNIEGTLGHLKKLRDATNRMNEMLGNILKLSRIGRTPLNRKRVDLAKIARKTFEDLQSTEPGRNVKLDTPGPLWVDADPTLIRDLLENLLGNAWKYTSREPEPRIEIKGERRGPMVWFCVHDNGIGFHPEEAKKLFVPFTRLPEASEYPGTGVGLATAKRIVERHGGQIEAKGNPGEGAEFCFTLPATADNDAPDKGQDRGGREHQANR